LTSARDARTLVALLALGVYAAGAAARLFGIGWDGFAALHPDERHMIFTLLESVRGFEALPPGTSLMHLWFATGSSPLDPRMNGGFFAYGELPHLIFVAIDLFLQQAGWIESIALTRLATSAVDSLTILAVFLTANAATSRPWAALAASAFYAFTPIAIQTANFATVDPWLAATSAWGLLAATRLSLATDGPRQALFAVLTGVAAGAAAACKLPGLFVLVALALAAGNSARWCPVKSLGLIVVGVFAAFVTFRLANPFAFAGPGPLGLHLSPTWLDNMAKLAAITGSDADQPSDWQWRLQIRFLSPLRDFALWGFGPGIVLTTAAGALAAFLSRDKALRHAVPAVSAGSVILIYYFTNVTPALRYALPAAPAVAIVCGLAFLAPRRLPILAAAGTFGLALTFASGVGVVRLHTWTTHPRVAASIWMWQSLPPGTTIANETAWDEGLPVIVRLPGDALPRWPDKDDRFRYEQLHIVNRDDAEKWRIIADVLDRTDVIAVSSGRQIETMSKMPERFPVTARYYDLLTSGRLCFAPIFEAGGRFPFLFWWLDDRGAQEPWTVYDHPPVIVFGKEPCFDRSTVEAELLAPFTTTR
jgi:hypothetical protein